MCLPLGLTDSHIIGSALRAGGFPEGILGLLTPEGEMDTEQVLTAWRLGEARPSSLGFILKAPDS